MKLLLSKPYLLPFLLKTKLDDWVVRPDRTLIGSNLSKSLTPGSWEKLPQIPTYRYEFGGAFADEKIFIIGGLTMPTVYTVTRLCETYNLSTKSWKAINNFPKIIHHPSVISVSNKIYVVGGNGLRITPYSSTYKYEQQTDAWVQQKDMPTARGALGVTQIEGIIYAIGGGAHKVALDANEAFDPAQNTWKKLAPMPTPREHLAVAAADGLIFAMGGYTKSLAESLNANEAYNPKTDSWEKRAPLPLNISGFSASALGDKIYIFGGEQGWAVSGECFEYRVKEDRWSRVSDLPTPRYASIAISVENSVHVIGGNSRLKGFEFCLAHEVFTPQI